MNSSIHPIFRSTFLLPHGHAFSAATAIAVIDPPPTSPSSSTLQHLKYSQAINIGCLDGGMFILDACFGVVLFFLAMKSTAFAYRIPFCNTIVTSLVVRFISFDQVLFDRNFRLRNLFRFGVYFSTLFSWILVVLTLFILVGGCASASQWLTGRAWSNKEKWEPLCVQRFIVLPPRDIHWAWCGQSGRFDSHNRPDDFYLLLTIPSTTPTLISLADPIHYATRTIRIAF